MKRWVIERCYFVWDWSPEECWRFKERMKKRFFTEAGAELWIARHCFSKQMRYRAVKLKKGEKL